MRTSAVGANKHHGDHDANFAAAAAAAAADDDETNAKTRATRTELDQSKRKRDKPVTHLRPQEAQSTDGEMFKTREADSEIERQHRHHSAKSKTPASATTSLFIKRLP